MAGVPVQAGREAVLQRVRFIVDLAEKAEEGGRKDGDDRRADRLCEHFLAPVT